MEADYDYFEDEYVDTYTDTPPEPVEMWEYFVSIQARWTDPYTGGGVESGAVFTALLDPSLTQRQKYDEVLRLWSEKRVESGSNPLGPDLSPLHYYVVPNTPDAPKEVPA